MNTQKIVVCGFIYKGNQMLAVQRPAHKEFKPNGWELVGGHVEFGESLEEGLKRELKEELNLEIVVGKPFAAFTYQPNEQTHTVEVIYLATVNDESTMKVDSDAAQAVKWVTKEEAIELYDNENDEYPFIMQGFDLI